MDPLAALAECAIAIRDAREAELSDLTASEPLDGPDGIFQSYAPRGGGADFILSVNARSSDGSAAPFHCGLVAGGPEAGAIRDRAAARLMAIARRRMSVVTVDRADDLYVVACDGTVPLRLRLRRRLAAAKVHAAVEAHPDGHPRCPATRSGRPPAPLPAPA